MSKTPISIQTVSTVLIIIAIVVSAVSLNYVMGNRGKIEKLTDSVAELESTIFMLFQEFIKTVNY